MEYIHDNRKYDLNAPTKNYSHNESRNKEIVQRGSQTEAERNRDCTHAHVCTHKVGDTK